MQDERPISEPLSIFLDVLREYLKSRGRIIKALADTSMQKNVKIEFYGLMRRFRPRGRYSRFMELVREILSNEHYLEILKEHGIVELKITGDDNGYLILDIERARSRELIQ